MQTSHSNQAILLVHCKDQKGLITVITQFLSGYNGNIVDLDEHVDTKQGVFFFRVQWELEDFDVPRDKIEKVFYDEVARKFGMTWHLYFTDKKPKAALFVSKSTHCLYDILARHQAQQWPLEISCIVSNHEDSQKIAQQFDIPFHVFSVNAANKKSVETQQMELLTSYDVDLIILARYMQILSGQFIAHFPNKVINIHHSFLPAFPGAKPYHQAFDRGVKIIGATSHYVTEDLDAGPIIEQDVAKISHKDDVQDLIRKGQDLEKIVLSRAIWAHINRKVLSYGNKTIVFD